MTEEFKMDELYHHGIKGQKWGVRRTLAQLGYKVSSNHGKSNSNDRITRINDNANNEIKRIKAKNKEDLKIAKAQGKAQYKINKANAKAQAKIEKALTKGSNLKKNKSIKDMSDEEINSRINRIRLENTLKSLQPEKVSKGKAFMESSLHDVLLPAARESGRRVLTNWFNEKGSNMLGLNAKDGLESLQKEVQKARLKEELNSYKNDNGIAALKERNEKARLEKEYNDMTNPDKDSIAIKDMQTWTKNMNTVMNYNKTSEKFNEFVKNNTNANYTDFADNNDDVIYQGQRAVAGLIEDKRM